MLPFPVTYVVVMVTKDVVDAVAEIVASPGQSGSVLYDAHVNFQRACAGIGGCPLDSAS